MNFEIAELKILVDAIQSLKFVSEKITKEFKKNYFCVDILRDVSVVEKS